MKKYIVSAFNHCNNIVLKDHVVFAEDFWDADKKVTAILTESGYDVVYTTVSIKQVDQT